MLSFRFDGQAKAKRIQHYQTSCATNAKGTSLGGKEKVPTRNKKITNGKAHWSRQHRVKVGNHPHTNVIAKPAVVQRAEHKCRILEMHWELKDQRLKTILFIYRLLYQNLVVNTNQKITIVTHKKEKESQTQH